MKSRLLTYCILLVLCFIDIKAIAINEPPDFLSPLSVITTENTEQAIDRMQLKGTDVEVNINGSIAEVTVKQQYKNNSDQIINGHYSFPAPQMALIHKMEMKTDGDAFTASVQEQKTAREEFTRFKDQGKNAILLEKENPNSIGMDLANIMPGETVDVKFGYTELLIPNDMEYRFVYPAVTDSGYSGRDESDFGIKVNISEGIPIRELTCLTHDTDIIFESESSAKVLLRDHAKKGNDRDYVLNFRLAERKMQSGLILSGGDGEKYLLFNDYVGSPGLKDISVKFTDLKTYDLESSNIPDFSARRPVTILGKWEGEADGFIKVGGRINRRNYSKTYRFVKNYSRSSNGALEHLWAEKRIERLSDTDNGNRESDVNSEITALGLKYNVLTKNTSLIAYNDIVRNPVIFAEEDENFSPLPEENSNPEPVKVAKVPEPGFYILMLIFSSIIITGKIRRKAVRIFARYNALKR